MWDTAESQTDAGQACYGEGKEGVSMNRAARRTRNARVFWGRIQAEAEPGTVKVVEILHNDGCPGLEQQSMLLCQCKPIIKVGPPLFRRE